MAFDVATHELLSAEAQALPEAQLEAEVRIAEIRLGFLDIAWREEDLPLASLAIVLQVNRRVADPDFGAVKREKKGDQETEYRDAKEAAGLDPTAWGIAEQLRARYAGEVADVQAEGWRSLTSLR